MTRKEIKEIVFRTFTDVIADDEAVITENSSIMDDLDMDSIEMQTDDYHRRYYRCDRRTSGESKLKILNKELRI